MNFLLESESLSGTAWQSTVSLCFPVDKSLNQRNEPLSFIYVFGTEWKGMCNDGFVS